MVMPVQSDAARIEISPTITVSGTYDDNIFLDRDDPEGDFITRITPGLTLHAAGPRDDLILSYSPSLKLYAQNSDLNTFTGGTSGSLAYKHFFQKYLHFFFNDTYTRSDEALEFGRDAFNIRQTGDEYQRNSASTGFDYQFGRNDRVTVGYDWEFLDNEDPAQQDSDEYGPFATFAYEFNNRVGIELQGRHETIDYQRDDGLAADADIDGYDLQGRLFHNFNPITQVFGRYRFVRRNSRDPLNDYWVHSASVGWEQSLSAHTAFSLEGGLFTRRGNSATIADVDGFTYDARLDREFERGSITVGTNGGWDESFLEIDQTGFTEFNNIYSDLEYQLGEDLNAYANASYRQDRRVEGFDPDRERIEAGGGLRWALNRWLRMNLGYTFVQRLSDDPNEEYTNNRVELSLSAHKTFKRRY